MTVGYSSSGHGKVYPLYSDNDCAALIERLQDGRERISPQTRKPLLIKKIVRTPRVPTDFPQNLPLNDENVAAIFNECLVVDTDHENFRVYNVGLIESVTDRTYFRVNTLAVRRNYELIDSWIDKLPKQFFSDGGGGWTFLNMFLTSKMKPWTSSPVAMEQLLILGIAAKRIKYILPRYAWTMFPENMPYIVIQDRKTESWRSEVKIQSQKERIQEKRKAEIADFKKMLEIRRAKMLKDGMDPVEIEKQQKNELKNFSSKIDRKLKKEYEKWYDKAINRAAQKEAKKKKKEERKRLERKKRKKKSTAKKKKENG